MKITRFCVQKLDIDSKYGNTSVWNNSYNEGEVYISSASEYGIYSHCGTVTGMVGSSKDENINYYSEKIAKTYNEDGSVTIKYKNINSGGSIGSEFTRTFYPYNSSNGVKGSTTGNIYGIYDMAGGAWEYMAAYVDNGGTNANSHKTGLSGKYANVYKASDMDDKVSTTDTNNKMAQANYNENSGQKGDAMFETSTAGYGSTSWGGDYSSFAFGGFPWFIRGCYFYDGSGAGVFAFERLNGWDDARSGFRVVLVP